MRTRLTYWLLLIACVIIPLRTWADQGGFYYENYDVSAVVHKDNVWDITETIQVFFNEPRHGIYSYIPTQFSLCHNVAQKGEERNLQNFDYYPEITEFDVEGAAYTIESGNNNLILRLGSEDETLLGSHTYIIKYRYTYPDDRIRTKDYILHTLHGADFNEETRHFHFDITLDKPIPDGSLKKLQVKMGKYGETCNADSLELTATANHICGTVENLRPNVAITLDIPLPEGYYENVKTVEPTLCWVMSGITLLCLLIVIVLALNIHHPDVTKQIEFYPPEGISSAEVGTIIDDSADQIDLASLIPWFASKGYLSIKEIEKRHILGKETILQLTRGKALDFNAPEYQKNFFKALFGKKNVIQMDQLEEKPELMHKALTGLGKEFSGEKKLTHWKKRGWLILLLILLGSHVLWFSCPEEEFSGTYFLFAGLLYLGPMLTIWTIIYNSSKSKMIAGKWSKLFTRFFCIGITFVCCLIWCIAFVPYGAFLNDGAVLLLYTLTYLALELSTRFLVNSEYRAQLMGKLLGLQEFIKTAELPRLESLLEDDPQYFYRILPYAMVFGLSDKWASQFKKLNMEKPEWYQASDANLNTAILTRRMTSNISSSATSAITTVSHDSSAASSSAGGGSFAGAGGGGGGGGSW